MFVIGDALEGLPWVDWREESTASRSERGRPAHHVAVPDALMGTRVIGRLRERRGDVLVAGLLVILGFVGVWGLVGCGSSRDDASSVTTAADTATPIAEVLADSPGVDVPTPTPTVTAQTPTATAAVPTPTPTVVVPAATPTAAPPTPTPRVVIVESTAHRDGPGVGFEECITGYFEWGPRHDYDSVAWSPDGSELYFTDGGDIYGVTADGSRLWLIASARPPDARSRQSRVGAWTSFAVAPDGANLAYTRCLAWSAEVRRNRIDQTSRVRQSRGVTYIERYVPQFADRYFELFRVKRDGTDVERLTENGDSIDFYPAWSPDGRRIAFLSDAERYDYDTRTWHSGWGLHTMAADGTDVRTVLGREFAVLHQPPQWSPDGQHLAVVRYMKVKMGSAEVISQSGRELYVVGADGAEPRRLADNVVSGPSWSPDGQRLAYARANVDGVALYAVKSDGTDERWITDIPKWRGPRSDSLKTEAWIDTVAWSPDGTRILVRSGQGSAVLVVSVESGQTMELGIDSALAAAWSPTGSRIALVALGQHQRSPPVLVASVAADGTDVQVLAGKVLPYDEHAPWQALNSVPVDAAACQAGVVVPDPDANPELVKDCLALVEIQRALEGGSALYWSADRPITGWEGVDVSGTLLRVRALTLRNRGLHGPAPPALKSLSALRELDLRGNELTGDVSSTLRMLPRLRRLDLGSNRLHGTIPSTLKQFPTLTFLSLFDNQLSGSIPPALGQLTNLRFLGLGSNALTGPIPAELGQLINLTDLVLSDNALTGPIPPELAQLANLERLYLFGNELTGEIPAELGGLARLRDLYLSDNRLEGPVPAELAELPSLQVVGLARNLLTGCVDPRLPIHNPTDLNLPACEPAA